MTTFTKSWAIATLCGASTDPNETLGAQQLKSEYGATRIRDKQQELVRLARDLVEITLEIITEKFDDKTIVEMSQTDLPTRAMAEQEINSIYQDLEQKKQQMQMMLQSPQVQQQLQQNPQMAEQIKGPVQQVIASAQKAIKKISEKPTIEQVLGFLRDSRIKNFVLDIETDSTIQITEETDKKRTTEFIGVLAQLLPQLSQMIMADAQTAPFAGELLKFATKPFRAGRSLDGAIDNLVELMKSKGEQQKPPDPTTQAMQTQLQIETMKNETAKSKVQADAALRNPEAEAGPATARTEARQRSRHQGHGAASQAGDDQAKIQVQNQKAMESREAHQAHMLEKGQDMELSRQKADLAVQAHEHKQADMANRASERQAMQQFKMTNPANGGEGRSDAAAAHGRDGGAGSLRRDDEAIAAAAQ